jgi:hypothetical protein
MNTALISRVYFSGVRPSRMRSIVQNAYRSIWMRLSSFTSGTESCSCR